MEWKLITLFTVISDVGKIKSMEKVMMVVKVLPTLKLQDYVWSSSKQKWPVWRHPTQSSWQT